MTPLNPSFAMMGDDVQSEHDEKYDTSGSCTAVDTVTATEAAELDAIALLAGTWDVDLTSDSDMSAQLVHSGECTSVFFFLFWKEKGKQRHTPCSPITSVTGRPPVDD